MKTKSVYQIASATVALLCAASTVAAVPAWAQKSGGGGGSKSSPSNEGSKSGGDSKGSGGGGGTVGSKQEPPQQKQQEPPRQEQQQKLNSAPSVYIPPNTPYIPPNTAYIAPTPYGSKTGVKNGSGNTGANRPNNYNNDNVIINHGGYYGGGYYNRPRYGGTTTTIGVSPYDGTVWIFEGYRPAFAPGFTYASPFGAWYACPPFISTTFVVTDPYPWSSGRELRNSFSYDRYFDDASTDFRSRALRAALNDVAAFWEENDARALRRRVAADLPVAVFQSEEYAYSLKRADFLALCADAIDRVQTDTLRFDNIRPRSDGMVNAYGTHRYRLRGAGAAANAPLRTATVRFTLAFEGGDWYVRAVSLSADAAASDPTVNDRR